MLDRSFPIHLALAMAIAGSPLMADDRPIALPSGQVLQDVDFERHVVPLLSRFGCNSGACHGSFQGRGGMRFSLFGHLAEMDYEALSLRIDTDDPSESETLLKPTAEIEHEGGKRFEKDSWPYQVMKRWIATGGNRSAKSVQNVSLAVTPSRIKFGESNSQRLTVTATINQAESIDVTSFCRFSSGDEGLATVDEDGVVRSIRPGATHVTVEYLGNFATVLTSAKLKSDADAPPQLLAQNFIDRHINDKLLELNLAVSPPASDSVFLRRVTLDTIARLPTVEEMESFAANSSPDRRRQVIGALLHSERHASLWATRLCDMTRCTADLLEGPDDEKPKRAKMWHDWFRKRFRENVPYDRIVRGVLCGTSVGDKPYDEWLADEANLIRQTRKGFESNYADREFLDLYWRRQTAGGVLPRRELAEITSAAFLGIQVECAQCHKHPYDRWTQAEYRSFVNIFSQVNFGSSSELNKQILKQLQLRRELKPEDRPKPLPKVAEIYNSRQFSRPLADAETRQVLPPKPLGGTIADGSADPRDQLMDWMTGEGQLQFARNFANRVWAHYFGRGIVEPVDGFSAINPPSHPELLDALAEHFIDSGYEVRQLEMTILSSAAYQRSSEFTGNNDYDRQNYARSYVRPLMAEAAIDVLHQSLGVRLDAGNNLPIGFTAIEHGGDRMIGSTAVARMLTTFGRGPRNSACDCDREQEPSLRQSLFQMSDPWMMESIRSGDLLKAILLVEDINDSIDLAFARILARKPTLPEQQASRAHLYATPDPNAAWTDLIWALVNTREFATNR